MDERGQNIAVGLTAVVALGGFGALLLLFGYVPQWLETGYEVKVTMTTAGGLSEGSRVQLDGIDIGRVDHVSFREPPNQGVEARLRIREDVRIPAEARVTVQSKLIGGAPTLVFLTAEVDPQLLSKTLAVDGSAQVAATTQNMFESMAARVDQRIELFQKEFLAMRDELTKLSTEWTAVGANVRELTAPRTIEEVRAGKSSNVASVLAQAERRMMELEAVIEGVNTWVRDEDLRGDVKETIRSTKLLMQNADTQLAKTAEEYQKLAGNAGEAIERLTNRYVTVAERLDATLGVIKAIAAKANEGDGTVAKLLNDPALYNNLNDSLETLEQALDEVKLMVEKLKKEGIRLNM